MKDIKEESVTVTIKKFVSRDGTEYISEGPSKHQIDGAKYKAEHQNTMYDYLHFEVDESLLCEYKSENWLHFKWQFFRHYLKVMKWSNGWRYYSLNDHMSYESMNKITEKDFVKMIQGTIFENRSREYGYLPKLYNNDNFLKILLFSGILDYESVKSPYRQSVSYKILKDGKQEAIPVSPTLDIDYRSEHLFNTVRRFNKTEFLKKLVKSGHISVTPDQIADYCRDVQGQIMDERTLHDYFHWSWSSEDGEKDGQEKDYLPKGTLKSYTTKKGMFDVSDVETKFVYYASEKAEKFLKICFDSCKSDKNEILKYMLGETSGVFFMGGEYGGVCIWYQHFFNMTEKQSYKKGQEIYASYVYLNTRGYDKLKDFAKPDDNFMDIILNGRIFGDQDYSIKEKINFLIEKLPHRQEEIELWSVWSTYFKFVPDKYNVIKKHYERKDVDYPYKYKDYIDGIQQLLKSTILQDKLVEIKKNQDKLKKEEKEILQIIKK